MKTLSLALSVLVLSAPLAFAQMNHSDMNHSDMDHSNMPMSDEMMEGAVHTRAVVNSIGEGTANVSHEPIPEIGWPAMTMDLAMMPDAEMMGEIAAGDSVTLMLIKGDDGMYAIGAMMPE
ncbi:Periplasmic copper-binding protein [Roseovarius sp. EC-HK134]|uniref:copper-binding protein n=1 Tax=unclassified Roseovarius TaxID=2614913 RepID=UPI00125B761D|nr:MULTISPECIES: copper-binding protein [unclassified Roseovarius]VVS96613.1 Periplasmic copper-binding protein [Roseovarius sp. EC-HK134]VVT00206.1 Periplasmic copper-binding protein [Roseovarius sp. EC-SD190]